MTQVDVRPHGEKHSHPLAIGGELVAVAAWGATAGWSRYSHASGFAFAFWRLGFGAALSYVALRLTKRKLTIAQLRLSIPGGLIFAAHLALFFTCIRHTTVANVTVIESLSPVLILPFARKFFGEAAGAREWSLALVAVAGVSVAVLATAQSGMSSTFGIVLSAFNLVSWTTYFMVGKKARRHLDAMTFMAGLMIVALIAFTPVALAAGHVLDTRRRDWLWFALVAIVPGMIGHGMINWAHKFVPVSVSAVMALGVPVVAAVVAWPEFGERITLVQGFGMAAVIGALAVMAVIEARRETVAAEGPGVEQLVLVDLAAATERATP